MGQLERLFLGSLVLTGLFILFLFGLYFDIGDMVAGTFKGNRVGFGQDQKLIATRRRLSQEEQPEPRLARRLQGRSGGSRRGGGSGRINYRKFVRRPQIVPRDALIDREVRRLQRKGFVDEQFIRMRAIYEIDRTLIPVFDQYDQLMDAEDPEGAIEVLQEALRHLEEENLLGKRDIYRYLYQAYVMAGKDREATEGLAQLTELHEHIVSIEERAELHQDDASQAVNQKMRQGLGQLRQALDGMKSTPGAEAKTWDMIRQIRKGEKVELDQKMVQGAKAAFLQQSGDPEGRKAARALLEKFQAGNIDQQLMPGHGE